MLINGNEYILETNTVEEKVYLLVMMSPYNTEADWLFVFSTWLIDLKGGGEKERKSYMIPRVFQDKDLLWKYNQTQNADK